jgi:hypothetical protein
LTGVAVDGDPTMGSEGGKLLMFVMGVKKKSR